VQFKLFISDLLRTIEKGVISIKKLIFTVFILFVIVLSGSLMPEGVTFAPTRSEPFFVILEENPPQIDDLLQAETPEEVTLPDSEDFDIGDSDDNNDDENDAGSEDEVEADDNESDFDEETSDNKIVITISAAGDTTLGGDPSGAHMFIREFEQHGSDHSHFLRNVRHIFDEDDLTIVNLEGTLTDVTAHKDKTFVLRGPPHFAKILSSSGVDAVTLANNHSQDFFERGYQDTVASLEEENVACFGNAFNTILEINGIRVGLFGHSIWGGGREYERLITNSIKDLRNRGAQLIIAYYHWGTERSNTPDRYQRTIGHFSIDNGADLVLGSHPHVLQGIEEYKGKFIVHSLANFSFGANNNPADHDTFIFQQSFIFENDVLLDAIEINIIPVLISSDKLRNNFQPTVAEGEDAERILQRIETYSDQLKDS